MFRKDEDTSPDGCCDGSARDAAKWWTFKFNCSEKNSILLHEIFSNVETRDFHPCHPRVLPFGKSSQVENRQSLWRRSRPHISRSSSLGRTTNLWTLKLPPPRTNRAFSNNSAFWQQPPIATCPPANPTRPQRRRPPPQKKWTRPPTARTASA